MDMLPAPEPPTEESMASPTFEGSPKFIQPQITQMNADELSGWHGQRQRTENLRSSAVPFLRPTTTASPMVARPHAT
jgi:hypothetical protein